MVSIRKRRNVFPLPSTSLISGKIQNFAQPVITQSVAPKMGPHQDIFTAHLHTYFHPIFEGGVASSTFSGSNSSHDETKSPMQVNCEDLESRRRRRQRKKHLDNQEPCMMRGVYFKNMKWQAAIKVDKKQIHLGTVSCMEEAAHLYDRAAYLCGREPNFELSEEEKRELEGFQWEEFLALTREEIANKKKQRKLEASLRRRRAAGLPLEEQN